jgi:enoyl-CoA hydratase
MKNDKAGEVAVDEETFGKGLNNVVKDIDMQYPPEWRMSRANRRKP